MAERRMFARTIIDSDAFLDMPITARLLYYDLAMRADDDGFVNAPKRIMRTVGASDDDLQILAAKKFIIPFDKDKAIIAEASKTIRYWFQNLDKMMDEGIGLYISSSTKGSGKTRMAASIANELMIDNGCDIATTW